MLYVAVQAGGAAAMSLLVFLFVHVVGIGKVEVYLVAIPPVTLATFVANRLWTFADRAASPRSSAVLSTPEV